MHDNFVNILICSYSHKFFHVLDQLLIGNVSWALLYPFIITVSLWQLPQILRLNSGIIEVFKLSFNAVVQLELKR